MKLQSDSIDQIATALCKAQGEMTHAKKDATNPFFKSKYADLASVWEACRPALTKNGLCIIQTVEMIEQARVEAASTYFGPYLKTILAHSSGQWVASMFPLRPLDDKPQTFGSLLSYYRRYALAAICSLTQEDDDSEAAMNRPTPQATSNYAPKKYTPAVRGQS